MTNIPKSKEGWDAVSWASAEVHVFKLQKRIYLASKIGDIKKIRKLQHTLINSHHAKLFATRRVTQDNQGKKTAGIDGIKLLKPKSRFILANSLKVFTKAKPLRRVWINKPGKSEKRPLGIPTMQDRATQALFKFALEPEWEAKFEPNSYGFRPGRSTHDALKQIYICIKQKPKYVLDADIAKCFDKIDQEKLLAKLGFGKGSFHAQIKSWLKSGVIDNSAFLKTESGTPQGGVISPLLANIALHGMEEMLKNLMISAKVRGKNGRLMGLEDRKQSLSIIRYADDFVVMHSDKDIIIKCRQAIEDFLMDIGLNLSVEKTRISHTLDLSDQDKEFFDLDKDCKPGFNFLGFTIRQFKSKYGCGKLANEVKTLITPSKKSCASHLAKLSLIIRGSKSLSQEHLIKKLNPIISGWARYAGKSDASTAGILSKLDFLLYLKLRQWAKRKTQSTAKGQKKYWRQIGSKKWVFCTVENVNLVLHSDYSNSIKEYVKVIGTSSPFDGNDVYWAARSGLHPLLSKSQVTLLKRQKGRCNLCGKVFRNEDIFEIDHIIPLSAGGKRSYNNIQLLHRHCHDQKKTP